MRKNDHTPLNRLQTTVLSRSMLSPLHPPRSFSLFTRLQSFQSLLFCYMPAPSSPRGLHFQFLFCQIIHPRPLCDHSSPFGLRALMPQRGRPHLPYLRGPGTIWSNLSMVESRKKFSFFAQKLPSFLFSQISLSSSFMAYWVGFMSLKYVLISWSPAYLKISDLI